MASIRTQITTVHKQLTSWVIRRDSNLFGLTWNQGLNAISETLNHPVCSAHSHAALRGFHIVEWCSSSLQTKSSALLEVQLEVRRLSRYLGRKMLSRRSISCMKSTHSLKDGDAENLARLIQLLWEGICGLRVKRQTNDNVLGLDWLTADPIPRVIIGLDLFSGISSGISNATSLQPFFSNLDNNCSPSRLQTKSDFWRLTTFILSFFLHYPSFPLVSLRTLILTRRVAGIIHIATPFLS